MSNPLPEHERSRTRPAPHFWWQRFSRGHVVTWGLLWLVFSVLTFSATSQGLTDKSYVIPATLATALGPMTGSISRGNQGCCLEFSLSLLPCAGGCVLVATAVQLVPSPRHMAAKVARLTLWSLGWFVWFASGIVSLGHALG